MDGVGLRLDKAGLSDSSDVSFFGLLSLRSSVRDSQGFFSSRESLRSLKTKFEPIVLRIVFFCSMVPFSNQ